jgi:putative peptide zinc metalloprotease protein
MADDDFTLPRLAPRLRLTRAPDERGEPAYTLHDPVANNYFRIDWVAFECLSRMGLCRTAEELRAMMARETTVDVSIAQIAEIVAFLDRSGLLALRDQRVTGARAELPLWKKIFHKYLFFSVPLFRPQAFLERTYRYVRWAYHPLFLRGMVVFLCVMVAATLWRADEFFHSFAGLMSAEGAMAVLLTFAGVKIVHEFAHAYTAVRYGVRVPHMGVAVMVMYPVLYTETSGGWSLPSRRQRFHIAIAGIAAELCLAAVALAVWHGAAVGSMAQSIAFLVVVVSLAGSLLINLNPLMRFDGYYMMADATGFDNLQIRACAFARHALRRILFGWDDGAPEDLPRRDEQFLTVFGAALLVYRFFLFLGIGLLVYHVFFQPLGFVLMVAELGWFIGLPVCTELRVWAKNRARIVKGARGWVTAAVVALLLLGVIVPWRTDMALPAVVHAAGHEVVHAPYAAQVIAMDARDGAAVKTEDVLAVLESPALAHDIAMARQAVERIETLRRRAHGLAEAQHSDELSDEALAAARAKLEGLQAQRELLTIRAPFDGVVRDADPDLAAGRFVMAGQPLFTLVDPRRVAVTAYATEGQREALAAQARAEFLSAQRDRRIAGMAVTRVAETGTNEIAWRELASVHGGALAADAGTDGAVKARRTLYEIRAEGEMAAPAQAVRGQLRVHGPAQSIFMSWIKGLASLFRREAGVG